MAFLKDTGHGSFSSQYSSSRSSERPALSFKSNEVPGVKDTKLTWRRCILRTVMGKSVIRDDSANPSPPVTFNRLMFCRAISGPASV